MRDTGFTTKQIGRHHAGFLAVVFTAVCLAIPAAAQTAETAETTTPTKTELADKVRIDALNKQREEGRGELEKIAADINLSKEKREQLETSINALKKDQATVRTALVQTAKTQKKLTNDISESELRMASLRVRDTELRASLRARRGTLAEVLAALQRMGRNPPPALLVSPEDALSSVRSAILLGAVVPEIRERAERLANDLEELTTIRASIANERERLIATLEEQAEEEEKLKLLLAEKQKLANENREKLVAESEAASKLAERAESMEDLIASLGTQIESVKKAAREAQIAEKEHAAKTQQQRDRARELAREGNPDANRFAPAFAFSDLKDKLELPVAGTLAAKFGDDDGTGRPLQGMMVSTAHDVIVTAPADGWVVYSGPFRSYGQLLILNAGDDFHLVLAGMGSISASIGQFVVAGEPVGKMDAKQRVASASVLTLASDDPTLYIEFRKGGKPVDPDPWWVSNPSGRVSNDS